MRGDKCVISYNPNDTSNVWLFENGEYISFSLIEEKYKDFSFEDVDTQIRQVDEHLKTFEEENVQARITLMNDLETIGAHRISITPKLSSVRKARKQERGLSDGHQR